MSSLMAQFTSVDHRNAQTYAIMKILKSKTDNVIKQNGALVWRENSSTISTYPCPKGLSCPDGIPAIATKDECMQKSMWDKDPQSIPTVDPSTKNGYFLQWREDTKTCFIGNHLFRNECMSGFPQNDEKVDAKSLPTYNKDTGQCLITKSYCDKFGYDSYTPGPLPNGDGGSCKLSGGMLVADALFGDTITRGVFGGGCF